MKRDKLREQIAADLKAFLDKGGTIQVVPLGATASRPQIQKRALQAQKRAPQIQNIEVKL